MEDSILTLRSFELADAERIALLANNKSPWVWHARIEAAIITAHEKQDYEGALYYLNKFDTDQVKYVPSSLVQRAKSLAHVYRLKMAQNKTAE